MKKWMTLLLVLAGTLYLGFKVIVWQRTSAALDVIRQAMADHGALDYGWVSSSLSGEIRIENVQLVSFALKESLEAEALILRAPGPWDLIQMLDRIARAQWPERLEWHLEGLRLELDSPALAQHLANPLVQALSSVACGQGRSLDLITWRAMGYWNLDGHMGGILRRAQNGRDLRLELNLELIDLGQMESELRFSGTGLKLASLRLSARDDGFQRRLMQYCRRLGGLSEADYLSRSLLLWERNLLVLGILPSSDFKQAYQMWLQGNRLLFLEWAPKAEPDFGQLMALTPEEVQNQLGFNLRVDDHVVRTWASHWDAARLKAVLDPEPATQEPLSPQSEPEPESEAPAQPAFRPTDPAELGNFLQYPVRVATHDGRLYEGRLVAVDERGLQVGAMVSGGMITYPVRWKDAERVEVFRP